MRAHAGEYERLGGDRFFHVWETRARLHVAAIRAAEVSQPLKLVANCSLGD